MSVGGVRVEVASRFEEGRSLNDNSVVLRLVHGEVAVLSPATWRPSPKRTSPGVPRRIRAQVLKPAPWQPDQQHGGVSCAVSSRRSPCTRLARGTGSGFRIPRWSRARLDDTSALRKAPWSPSPMGGPRACIPGASDARYSSKRRVAKRSSAWKFAAHRRRPGLAFPGLAWPLAQPVQVELPPGLRAAGAAWAFRSRTRRDGQLHRPPAMTSRGSFSVRIDVHRVPRVETRTDPCLPGAAGEAGVEERVGRREPRSRRSASRHPRD